MRKTNRRYFAVILLFLNILLLAAFSFSFLVGRYAIPPKTVWEIILSRIFPIEPTWEETLETVILQVRLPRILLGILVGGALSLSGASYQTLFKNPMVSPDILGVSAGAGFGAALAMVNEASWWEIQLCGPSTLTGTWPSARASGYSSRVISLMKEDLPQPLGPRMAVCWPCSMRRSSSCRTRTWPRMTQAWSSSIRGAAAAAGAVDIVQAGAGQGARS